MASAVKYLSEHFLDLIFPRLCISCQGEKPIQDHILCLDCLTDIAFTEQHLFHNNEFTEHFWGRIPISFGASMMLLDGKEMARNLIHKIKYGEGYDVGIRLGRWYGKKLLDSPHFETVDLIVPVPLHRKKMRSRGYNQSEAFAKGIAESTDRQLSTDFLIRTRNTKSQTKMNRLQRIDNLQAAFQCHPEKANSCQHVLLVDDVMTTGSTLESCALAILQKGDWKISMATIAMGNG